MPYASPKPCRHPGCRAVTTSDYCPEHRPDSSSTVRQQIDPRYAFAKQIRGTAHWRKCVAIMRAKNPLCCDPYNSHGANNPALTEDIHHIVPLIDKPELAFHEPNLAPVCKWCHSRVEQMERAGTPTAYLFPRATEEDDGGGERSRVTVVYGPPGAGKTTFVQQQAKAGDLIVDFDHIFSALSGQPAHIKPPNLFPFALAARDAVEAALLASPSQRAFVIYSILSAEKRSAWEQAGAAIRLVFEPRHICEDRCARRGAVAMDWGIDRWFESHGEDARAALASIGSALSHESVTGGASKSMGLLPFRPSGCSFP